MKKAKNLVEAISNLSKGFRKIPKDYTWHNLSDEYHKHQIEKYKKLK